MNPSRPVISIVTMQTVYVLLISRLCFATPADPVHARAANDLNSTAISDTIDPLMSGADGRALSGMCSEQAHLPNCRPCSEGCCDDYVDLCDKADNDTLEAPRDVDTVGKNPKLGQFSCSTVNGETSGYLLISTCSEDHKEYTYASRQCPGKENAPFFSIANVTVTSRTSGLSYRNVYCAVCNNETVADLRAWPVDVTCGSTDVADYRALLARLRDSSRDQEEECRVRVQRPQACDAADWETPAPRGCTRHWVTRCSLGIFKTVNRIPAGQLDVEQIPPISILMDFRSSSHLRVVREQTVVDEERVLCPAGHVFDPFTSQCQQLFCKVGYILQTDSGQCVAVPGNVKIHVTRTVNGNGTQTGCLVHQEETALCIARFLEIETHEINLLSEGNLQSGGQTEVCLFTFLLDSSDATFETIGLHLLSPWSQAENLQSCHKSRVWLVKVERQMDDTDASCMFTRRLNDTAYFIQVNNFSFAVDAEEQRYSLEQVTVRATFRAEGTNFSRLVELEICEDVKLTCPLIYMSKTLFRKINNASGSVEYIHTGRVFSNSEYKDTGDGILVCSFLESNGTRNTTVTVKFFAYSQSQVVLSLVGNVVSMVAGGLTFLTYFLFEVLRNHATCCVMNLVASLFMAQLMLLLTSSATANPAGCTMVAALSHYLWLVNVFWTAVLAYDLSRTFAGDSCLVGRACKTAGRRPRLRTYVLLTWGGSLLIVIPCLVISSCDCTEIPLRYGSPEVCWIGNGPAILVVFGAPVALVMLTNSLLFAKTVCSIRKTTRDTRTVKRQLSKLRTVKEEMIIYLKISSLMGFTWIFGFAAALSDVGGLWYAFILTNTCQGLTIFLSFLCKQRVRILWLEAFCTEFSRKRSYSLGMATSSASATRISRV
ncbi:uncharacterized protein LOC110975080 [Acanthaster planci]|uniref:Uncharacterized protein LOC110975080 n=1 Tax=Acanthaster planci TaxID=133434 RepID=A0A8B7XQ03_ACAPL|nr:uncharacterized protein LOC110975080 [Acanthaster planci]